MDRQYNRWLTNVTVDLSENIDFYEKEIEKVYKIITNLS